MQRSLVSALLLGTILGLAGCSQEAPEGTAEKMGKKIDEAVESAQQQVSEAVESAEEQVSEAVESAEEQVSEAAEAAEEQTAETKAELGAAMEEKGKEMQEEAEKANQ